MRPKGARGVVLAGIARKPAALNAMSMRPMWRPWKPPSRKPAASRASDSRPVRRPTTIVPGWWQPRPWPSTLGLQP